MQQLTLLEGVNLVLLKNGALAAADLAAPLTETQLLARFNLESKTQELLARQWAFNKVSRMSLTPDINGEILLPENWQLTSPYYPVDQGVLRFINGRLYNDHLQTNVFTQPVFFNARLTQIFINMPYGHQYLAVVMAAIALNLTTKANPAIAQMLAGELPDAKQAAMSADQLLSGGSFFSYTNVRNPRI